MNTGSIREGDNERWQVGEVTQASAVFDNIAFTFKRNECWSHGKTCGRVSKHRPQKRAAEYCNRNRNICRVTLIRTLMQKDMDG